MVEDYKQSSHHNLPAGTTLEFPPDVNHYNLMRLKCGLHNQKDESRPTSRREVDELVFENIRKLKLESVICLTFMVLNHLMSATPL